METLKNLVRYLFGSSVRSEIMKTLNSRIDLAEKDFKEGVNDIKTELLEEIESAKNVAELQTKMLLETLVKDLFGELTQ